VVKTNFTKAYKYKYNGKEFQDELGLNMYDYGARNYDPAIGRWMNIDPLAEIYYSNNSFMYCNNNPILYIDPNGMYFTRASYEFIDRYRGDLDKDKKKNNESIANLVNKIAEGGSENKLESWSNQINDLSNKNDEINAKLFEVDLMEQSNQVYHIQEINAEHGVTAFVSNTVLIGIPRNGYQKDLLSHELKHGYQFEIGELSLSQLKGRNKSFLYDKTDEVEGYKRGNESYGITNLPQIYDDLPKGPLNIHNNGEIIKALGNPDEKMQKQELQNIANKERAAFRVNCQTYSTQ